MAKHVRRTYSLTPYAAEVLTRVGNASGYLSQLVVDAMADWTHAMHALMSAGWQLHEMTAACEALMRITQGDRAQPPLHIILRSGHTIACEYGIGGRRWSTLTKKLADDHVLALAIATLTREYWRENAELRGMLNCD